MTKAGKGGIGTTLVLALLLVVVSLAAGVGFTYLIWDPTGPDDSTVVLGIRRLNELATVEQTVQAIVTEEENDTLGPVPVPEWLRGEKLLLVAVGPGSCPSSGSSLRRGPTKVSGWRSSACSPRPRTC